VTAFFLLEALKAFIEDATKDIILQVRDEEDFPKGRIRAPKVHLMHLPEIDDTGNRIPFILLQFVTGKDEPQNQTAECRIRIVFAAYASDRGKAGIDVLNMTERVRIALLSAGGIEDMFFLQEPLERILYPADTEPYYMGEMLTVWSAPTIEREDKFYVEEGIFNR
jgi:hypothetical protein